MPVLLCSDLAALAGFDVARTDSDLVVLLTTEQDNLGRFLSETYEDLVVVDVTGPRLSRLNFDVVSTAFVDLSPELLLSQAGRRLMDALGHLATQDEITLVFAGEVVSVIGGFLLDGVTAGLNLIPGTVVIADVKSVPDIRQLLTRLSETGIRLLALDGPVCALFRSDGSVEAKGEGSVLIVGFVQSEEGTPTARLQPLTDGMRRRWPG